MRMLKLGDTGDDVLRLQNRLYSLGYHIKNITGTFDEHTALALMSYQRASGIFSEYGFADEDTFAALGLNEEEE